MSVSIIQYDWQTILNRLIDKLYSYNMTVKTEIYYNSKDIDGNIYFYNTPNYVTNDNYICEHYYNIVENKLYLLYVSHYDNPFNKYKNVVNREIIKLMIDIVLVLFMVYHENRFTDISIESPIIYHTEQDPNSMYCYYCHYLSAGLELYREKNIMISTHNSFREKLYEYIKNVYNI
jgi:hypothetical protein